MLVSYKDDPCELYCTDSDDTLIVPWGDSAADGTPCTIGKNDMCISGICRVRKTTFIIQSFSYVRLSLCFPLNLTESWL